MNFVSMLRVSSISLMGLVLFGMVASNTIFNGSLNYFTYFVIAYLVVSFLLLVVCLYALQTMKISIPYKKIWSWVIVGSYFCGMFVFIFPLFAYLGSVNESIAHT